MKKNGIGLRFLPILALAAFLAFSVPGTAQPDYQPSTSARLKVQHVRAAIMFWWLTGEKNAQEKHLDSQSNGFAKSLSGLRKLAFNPAANELTATGTPEGIEALREVLRFLDRPIRKVELQVQAIEVDEAYIEQAKWFAHVQKAAIHDSDQFQLLLKAAIEQKQTGDIQTHRVEVLNNSKATLSVEENALLLGWEMALTPTIQNDDTVTLFCSPQLKTTNSQLITTLANLRQKDTALFGTQRLEQPGRVLLFAITVLSVAPQPE